MTGLWGLMIEINNLVSSPLTCFLYVLSERTWHSSRQEGKKKLDMGFHCLDCFANPVSVSSTPSDLNDLILRSSLDHG